MSTTVKILRRAKTLVWTAFSITVIFLALIVGLGGMLRTAYGYNAELFMFDQLDPTALRTSARNVEVLAWKLKKDRQADGSHFLVTSEYRGKVDNLSFERLFGKLIVLQEVMADIAGDTGGRTFRTAVRSVSTVFLPMPI